MCFGKKGKSVLKDWVCTCSLWLAKLKQLLGFRDRSGGGSGEAALRSGEIVGPKIANARPQDLLLYLRWNWLQLGISLS